MKQLLAQTKAYFFFFTQSFYFSFGFLAWGKNKYILCE